MSGLIEGVRDAAHRLGFDVVGIASAEPFERERTALVAACAAGHAAGMAYLARDAGSRADPAAVLPGVRSIVSVAVDYGSPAPPFAAEGRFGRVARYAWGRDYHAVVRPRLAALAREVEALCGRGTRTRHPVDAAPLLEKAVAARAGLGFVGKHTVLVLPRRGSWWLLGEILVDADLPPTPLPRALSCGTCRRCLDACPTDAFPAPYRLDARRCLAYWTIEHRGAIPRALRESLGAWVFGCDLCQEACPFNRFARETPWRDLGPAAGVGPRLDLAETLSIPDEGAFSDRFAGTSLRRATRAGLLRNAAVVARNVGAAGCVPALVERVERDVEPVVRGHALWALAGLAPERARALAERLVHADPDPSVREEAEAGLAGAVA